MFEKTKEKKKEKEYLREYNHICNIITDDMVKHKRLIIIYDDIIPDMFVKVPVQNKYVDYVNFDIYSTRLKKVKVHFPNGKSEYFKIIDNKKVEVEDEFCTATWEEPMIMINYEGYPIFLSIIDLICSKDTMVEIIDYDLKGIDFDGE